MIVRCVELAFLLAIFIACITQLNRSTDRPWYEVVCFAGVASASVWTAFDPLGRYMLFGALAGVFMWNFALERREMRNPQS